jgi:hypothetical protein
MRIEPVEIYSDKTNMAVLRHPKRKSPGVLIQGDDLHVLCCRADKACSEISRSEPGYAELNQLRNALWSRLNHYKATLVEYEIPMPFTEDHGFYRF